MLCLYSFQPPLLDSKNWLPGCAMLSTVLPLSPQTPYFWPSNCWEPENTDYGERSAVPTDLPTVCSHWVTQAAPQAHTTRAPSCDSKYICIYKYIHAHMCTDDASSICESDSRMNHECSKAVRFPAAGASVCRARNFRKVIYGSEIKSCQLVVWKTHVV